MKKIAVVIPAFRASKTINKVIKSIPDYVDKIYIVDDGCPDNTGQFVESQQKNDRLVVIYNSTNLGVGGAVVTGYLKAYEQGCDIAVKVDADGQMDCNKIRTLIQPIIEGLADYTKGNRFFELSYLKSMPKIRLFGNATLSFFNKLSSGYWNIMDPTNGFTAIHLSLLNYIDVKILDKRYFFESDLLFRLGTIKAVVRYIPIPAIYNNTISYLSINKSIIEFLIKHLRNTLKRVFYNYFLRDFNVASIQLVVGLLSLLFGTIYGAFNWVESITTETTQPFGVIMIATMPIFFGVLLLINAINWDINQIPSHPLHPYLSISPNE
ncbi:glycosyltransferase family 2 protein [Spartinivicinus ruber]|uniref:glycosyltransferase family 2 protein n=1 Tax=Spartinivicinus ruber TaxID=2683272 RepID=UPI0013D6A739|nr:glycosyltransferase family 2 protein [Spartinivicinus ruber]